MAEKKMNRFVFNEDGKIYVMTGSSLDDICAGMGITEDRLYELLSRDAYCPTLSAAPSMSTLTYIDTDGSTNHFHVGQLCRWAEDNKYRMAVCTGISDTESSWQTLPLKLSELEDDMGYVTDDELSAKGYATTAELSAKQDKISDLETIRENAAKGATALQSYTETDPTVPSWAKATSKPTYTAAEVGALPDTTAIPSKVSELTNDSGYTTNTGTITGITMNGSSKGTSGTVNLGYVITGDGTITKIVKVSSLPSSPESTTLYIIPE